MKTVPTLAHSRKPGIQLTSLALSGGQELLGKQWRLADMRSPGAA